MSVKWHRRKLIRKNSSHFPFHLNREVVWWGQGYLEISQVGISLVLHASLSLGLSATHVDQTMRM